MGSPQKLDKAGVLFEPEFPNLKNAAWVLTETGYEAYQLTRSPLTTGSLGPFSSLAAA